MPRKMTLDTLVAQLVAALGSELRAVVLYGSAATGEHIAKQSDLNVLVIADRLDLDALRKEAAVARAWSEAGNAAPLTLTTEEWRSSADIFPMEYADILAHHRVLHGEPPFDGIQVDPRNLRLQLEHQAMGKLLQLRRGIIAAHGEQERLVALLAASLTTFMVIFRSLIRLSGDEPPTDYEALSREVATRARFDAEPFLRVVRHVRGGERLPERDLPAVLGGYLAGAEKLASHIDGLDGGGGGSEA
ncbi:MAG TPA: nucleotidyltransferase domain-containing protein [Gemmatimonadaceae bacterium]|nr:nucleotidyltransferase domain-containing protein [Gemmatimonadaceae bacterium]